MRIRIKGGTGFRHNLCNLWLTCNKLPAGSCPNDGQETLISLKIIVDLKQPDVVAEAVPDFFGGPCRTRTSLSSARNQGKSAMNTQGLQVRRH
jgi:hypothetical protein